MLNELQTYRVLIVEDNYVHRSETMRMAVNRLESALKSRHITVLRAYSYNDAKPLAANDMDLDAFLVASDMSTEPRPDSGSIDLLHRINRHQRQAPVFLLADRDKCSDIFSPDMLKFSSELVWIFEDSPDFIAG
ncbi:MAG: hypothetical protein J6S19_02915, partial [Lentisphaeria bacterium]|nr:hypothetical protein [Lentisphaeria bacterium]